jgi:hypothetical protein
MISMELSSFVRTVAALFWLPVKSETGGHENDIVITDLPLIFHAENVIQIKTVRGCMSVFSTEGVATELGVHFWQAAFQKEPVSLGCRRNAFQPKILNQPVLVYPVVAFHTAFDLGTGCRYYLYAQFLACPPKIA